MKTAAQLLLDRFAIGASVLCALHCAVLPIFMAVYPSLISLPVDDHVFHELLVWLVLPSSAVAVFLGCRSHKDRQVMLGAALGLTMLVLTAFYGHDVLGETGEKISTFVAAMILASAHWRNFSLCRNDSCSDCG